MNPNVIGTIYSSSLNSAGRTPERKKISQSDSPNNNTINNSSSKNNENSENVSKVGKGNEGILDNLS